MAHDRAIPVVPKASFEARWLWAWSEGESPGIRDQVPTDESEGSARDEFGNDDCRDVLEKSSSRLGTYRWAFTGRGFVAQGKCN